LSIQNEKLEELDRRANNDVIRNQWTRLVKTVYEGIFAFDDDRDLTREHYTSSMDFASKRSVYESIHNALAEAPDGPYLEIGSGYGTFVLLCDSVGVRCFGCEPDSEPLAIAASRKQAAGVDASVFLQGVGESLPYRDGSFGLVLLDNVLEHVQDIDRVLSEAWRVLKPGGALWVVAPNYASFRREAHYGLPWLPLLPRTVARWYVRRFRGNTAFFDSLNYTTVWGIRSRLRRMKGRFVWPTIEKIRNPADCSNPPKRRILSLAGAFGIARILCGIEWLRLANPLSKRIELLVRKPPDADTKQGPQLLCLPADSPDSLLRLGVGSFIWNHYAPPGLFDRVTFAFLGNESQSKSLEAGRHLQVYRKRFADHTLVKGLCYLFRVPYFALRLVRTILRDRVDVVRARSLGYNAAAGIVAAKLTGKPCAVSIHAPYATDRHYAPKPFFADLEERLLEQFCLRFADRIYCVSTAMVDYAARMGADRSRTSVLHNRVDLDKFRKVDGHRVDEIRSQLGLTSNHKVAITVGRIVPQKDPRTFLDALRRLVDADPSWRLIVIGVGNLEAASRAYVKRHGLEPHVLFLGNVNHDDLPTYFGAADLFLLSALYEGFGIVLIEAQAAGLPVVATRISGTTDVVNDANADLVLTGDAGSLAKSMARVFTEADRTREQLEVASASVEAFDEKKIMRTEINDYLAWLPSLFRSRSTAEEKDRQ